MPTTNSATKAMMETVRYLCGECKVEESGLRGKQAPVCFLCGTTMPERKNTLLTPGEYYNFRTEEDKFMGRCWASDERSSMALCKGTVSPEKTDLGLCDHHIQEMRK